MSCTICNATTCHDDRKAHAAIHGYPNCNSCNRVFKSVTSFEKHFLAPHPFRKCQLDTCDEEVMCGKELQHAIEAHNYPNCFCGEKVETTWSNFYRHVQSHKEGPQKCPCCDVMVPIWQGRDHATTSHGFPKCPVCDENINSNFAIFYRHVVSHKNEVKKCTVCDEDVLVSEAKQHATTVHGFPECPVCEEVIHSNHANFLSHLLSHKTETCKVCNETVQVSNAKQHAITAHGFPTCPVCDKKINSNYGIFYAHLASHEVETKCPHCPETVKQKNLKAHAESHACAHCTRKRTLDDVDVPPLKRNRPREHAVTCFISNAFPSVKWAVNKRVIGGRSRFRPDMVSNVLNQVFMVEVDEKQHRNARYSSLSEDERVKDLTCDVGHRPTVIIRFNPDGYVDENGEKIRSCFGFNEQGKMVVKTSKTVEWEQRLATLRDTVEYWMCHCTLNKIEVVNLFFNKS